MKSTIIIIFSLFHFWCAGQTAALEIISDTSCKIPFKVFINQIEQNKQPASNLKIYGFPLEVYMLEVRLQGDTVLKSTAFLNVGKIRNYLVSYFNKTYFLTEGPLATENHPTPKDSVKFNDIEPEVIAALEAPITQSAFDDSPPLIKETEPIKTVVKTVNYEISPAQQQALERLKAKPVLGDNTGPDCFLTIDSEDLENIKTRMLEENLPKEKLNFSASVLSNKCLTVYQIKILMRTIDGDDLKLEFYKRLSRQLIDPENKIELASLFTLDTTVETFKNLP